MVPFAAALATEMWEKHRSTKWKLVQGLFHWLLECAKVAASNPFHPAQLADASRRVCLLWAQLAQGAEREGLVDWRIKPKFHLFQELCEYKAQAFGSPELFWTYADESWCGFMAQSAKRRGGQNPAAAVPSRLLDRFRAMAS